MLPYRSVETIRPVESTLPVVSKNPEESPVRAGNPPSPRMESAGPGFECATRRRGVASGRPTCYAAVTEAFSEDSECLSGNLGRIRHVVGVQPTTAVCMV